MDLDWHPDKSVGTKTSWIVFFLVSPTSIFMKGRITIQDVDKNCETNLKQLKTKISQALCNRRQKKMTDLDWHADKSVGTKTSWIVFFLVFPTSIFMKERITIQDVDKNCKTNRKQSKAKMSQTLCNR